MSIFIRDMSLFSRDLSIFIRDMSLFSRDLSIFIRGDTLKNYRLFTLISVPNI